MGMVFHNVDLGTGARTGPSWSIIRMPGAGISAEGGDQGTGLRNHSGFKPAISLLELTLRIDFTGTVIYRFGSSAT